MKSNHFKLLLITFLFLIPFFLTAQQDDLPGSDSVPAVSAINLSEISRRSAELSLKVKDIISEVISDDELNEIDRENDSIIKLIDSLMLVSDENVSTLSTRNLNGKIRYWELNLQFIKKRESKLASVFEDIKDNRETLRKELLIWNETDKTIEGEEMTKAIHYRFEEMKYMIDTALHRLDIKSAKILLLMDKISIIDVQIESFISNLKVDISNKQKDILLTDHPSFFTLEFSDINSWRLPDSMWKYYAGNFNYLKDYLNEHLSYVFFHFLLIAILIYLFIKLGKSRITGGSAAGGMYKKRLKIILSKPISAALIIGIFASAIIYPYRPLMFMDITRIMVVVPLVIILTGILPRNYHLYTYSFGIGILLQTIYINLPIDNIGSRVTLLFIALTEILPSLHYLVNNRKKYRHRGKISIALRFVTYVILIASSIGLLANIFGRVMLSFLLVEGVLGLILISILFTLTALVLNGLLMMLIDSHHTSNINIIQKNKTTAKSKLTGLINLTAIVLGIYFMLTVLNLESIVIDAISDFFLKERSIGLIVYSWGKVLLFFVVLWLSTVIAGFIRVLLEDDILNKVKMEKGLPHTISLLVKYSLVTLGVFVAVSAVGLPLDSLTVIIGAFGVGIGFGLQNIFNNLVSGLILLFERPIKINDTIEVGTLMGNVRSIGIRSSNVRTFDGAEIIVPNGNLISNEVVNWTLSDQTRRIEVIVGVSYNSEPHHVQEVLMKILADHKDIVKDPAPNVLFQNLGESSLDFRMLCWTDQFDQWIRIKSEIIFKVFDELKAANIEIPFPQRDLHVRSVDGDVTFKTGINKEAT